jgi:hypothetical protein
MVRLSLKLNGIVLAGTIGISLAIAISSFSVVRAQRFAPLNSVSYSCTGGKGSACVTGESKGKPWGLLGESPKSHGVVGISTGLGKAGVAGYSSGSGPGGYGVYAESADSTGKYAALDVQGDASGTNLFYAYNSANKTLCLIDPNSNLTCHGTLAAFPSGASANGVIGQAQNGYGVAGVSSTGDGIHGETHSSTSSAVAGIASSGAFGVYGSSSSGTGVYGSSSGAYGVYGTTSSSSDSAVYGASTGAGGDGIIGTADGNGVVASGSHVGLSAETPSTSGYALVAQGVGSSYGYCTINYFGDEKCSGTITGGPDMLSRHQTNTGRNVLAHAAQSTSATIEDFGTARLIDGMAAVRIDSAFASTIDRSQPYYVFLTPLGDTRGLYVSAKTAAEFLVRETQHGHSTLGFDYRIVAHPVDAGNDRLAPAPPVRVPRPQLPRPPRLPAQQH